MSTWAEWQSGVVNRNYFLFKQLESDPGIDKIISIDYLPFTYRRGIKYICQNRGVNKWQSISDKVIRYATCLSVWSAEKMIIDLKNKLSEMSIGDFILWSYLPTFPQIFGQLGEKFSVFEAVDDWSLHPSYSKIKDKLEKNYRTIKEKADFIFTVAPSINELFSGHPQVHWIPNGVDFSHFQNKEEMPKELAAIKKPIIGYIGTIQSRVDLDLIKYLAVNNQDKSIVLIGPVWPDANMPKITGLKNVHLIDRVRYEETPYYLNQFTVGIVPHESSGFFKTMNPMKIYEYLACGKPIVSNAMFGFDQLAEHIAITNDYQEFNQLVNRSIIEDSPEKIARRKDDAKINSWRARYEKMWEVIDQKI
ncbi:glycosyltransferase [Patescibacteria group bacterium]|nr:glycosyltransferase [Patescibacteria group bacterium]